jgi:hypothetical protein
MWKIAAGIAALLALPASAVAQGSADSQRLTEAVTFIRVGVTDPASGAERVLTTGSGFLIDARGHIVTARHVVMARESEPGRRWVRVSLRDRESAPYTAQVVGCGTGNVDICVVKIRDAVVEGAGIRTFFRPACRHLTSTETILSYGFPFGTANPAIRVPGEVTGDLGAELKHPSNVQIIPGMSGGPVLDTAGYAVALNAAGVEGMPTMTFLQPLVYGGELIRQTGVPCETSAQPAAVRANCPVRTHRIDRTQLSQNETGPSQREYRDTIQPDPGCRIANLTASTPRNANNSEGPTFQIAPGGASAVVIYRLTSGPFYDRYRGWLDVDVSVTQEPAR